MPKIVPRGQIIDNESESEYSCRSKDPGFRGFWPTNKTAYSINKSLGSEPSLDRACVEIVRASRA